MWVCRGMKDSKDDYSVPFRSRFAPNIQLIYMGCFLSPLIAIVSIPVAIGQSAKTRKRNWARNGTNGYYRRVCQILGFRASNSFSV